MEREWLEYSDFFQLGRPPSISMVGRFLFDLVAPQFSQEGTGRLTDQNTVAIETIPPHFEHLPRTFLSKLPTLGVPHGFKNINQFTC